MATYKQLEQQINDFNQQQEFKEAKIVLLQTMIDDGFKPFELLNKQATYFLEMIDEYDEYFKTRTPTEKNKASRKRLMNLLLLNTEIGYIPSENHMLRLSNKQLALQNSKLMDMIIALKAEVEKFENVLNF